MENSAEKSTMKIQRHSQIKCIWVARKERQKLIPNRVQSKTELFNKLTTTREADEKDQTKEKHSLEERSLLLAMIWQVMPKNALRDSANWQRNICLLPSRSPHHAEVITKYLRIIMK